MQGFAANFLNFSIIASYLPDLLQGLLVTVELAALVLVTGLALGTMLAVLRCTRWRIISFFIVLFADIVRSVPPLMLMVLAFFGLPYFGLRLGGFIVSWLVLGGVFAAFTEELLWAGITALPVGQWEAARSTGLSFTQTIRCVVLPQAFRTVQAPLTSRLISTTKNTSLASVVAVPELLAQANDAQGYAGNASPLTAASFGYLIILLPMVFVARRFERRSTPR